MQVSKKQYYWSNNTIASQRWSGMWINISEIATYAGNQNLHKIDTIEH